MYVYLHALIDMTQCRLHERRHFLFVFRSMSRVPYLARLHVYWREAEDGLLLHQDGAEAEIRFLLCTEGETDKVNDNCLETREGFRPLVSSPELVVWDKSELELRVRGNLGKVAEGRRIVFRPFRENRTTVGVRKVQPTQPAAGTLEILTDESSLFSSSILLPIGKRA